jgi:hypothetical protein
MQTKDNMNKIKNVILHESSSNYTSTISYQDFLTIGNDEKPKSSFLFITDAGNVTPLFYENLTDFSDCEITLHISKKADIEKLLSSCPLREDGFPLIDKIVNTSLENTSQLKFFRIDDVFVFPCEGIEYDKIAATIEQYKNTNFIITVNDDNKFKICKFFVDKLSKNAISRVTFVPPGFYYENL